MLPAWLSHYEWRQPLWLLLALQPWLLLVLRALWRRQQLQRYAEPALQAWAIFHEKKTLLQRLWSRDTAHILAWLLLAIAAAGPRTPLPDSDEPGAAGVNIMLVVDISRSMSASDVRPTRLRRARLEIEELLNRAPGNRFGIIVYAAQPHLYVPLTGDYPALRNYLQYLDRLVLPTLGSQTGDALTLAQSRLAGVAGKNAILLLTDGDLAGRTNVQRAQLRNIVTALAEDGLPTFILGTGSVEGDAIPLANGGWLIDNGVPVVSRMDESFLQVLAETGQGRYSPVYDDDSDWVTLYDNGIARRVDTHREDVTQQPRLWQEDYTWFLVPGLLFLLLALYPHRLLREKQEVIPALCLLLTAGIFTPGVSLEAAEATQLQQRAYLAYAQGEFDKAARQYAQLDSFAGHFGEGASYYRLADYPAAVRQFSFAVLSAATDHDRATALYNLANSYFQQGAYRTAIDVYRDALHYQPGHAAALQNLGFSESLQKEVEKRLAESILVNRGGRGPRAGRAETGTEIGENSAVSVDDSDVDSPGPAGPASPAMTEQMHLDELVRRGVEHARLAASDTDNEPGIGNLVDEQSVAEGKRLVQVSQDEPALLWKRVFEIEEGFAAVVETPRPVDGLAPW